MTTIQLISKFIFLLLFHFLFQYQDFYLVSIAHCGPLEVKNEVSSPNLKLVVSSGLMFSASFMVFKSMPIQSRAVTSLGIAITHGICSVATRATDARTNQAIADSISKSGKSSDIKVSCILENNFNTYCQSEYFIIFMCLALIILAYISFTIIVLWNILHKYHSWGIFHSKKIQNKLVWTCIELIKKISTNQIWCLVFFFYISLCICIYLLLTCF